MIVTSLSPYEQTVFQSKTDWRARAIAATSLPIRASNLFVESADIKDTGFTYVFPKSLLRKFVSVGDLRVQVAAFMFGSSPADNPQVKEIKCLVFVPQVGSHQSVSLAMKQPDHEYLSDLEPLGWIHTLPQEAASITPASAALHGRMLSEYRQWSADSAIVAVVSFPPGSVCLAGYSLNPSGVEWTASADASSFVPSELTDKAQIILTDAVAGWCMAPEGGVWNYSFMAVKHRPEMEYQLVVDNPLDFYDPSHRAAHFLTFSNRGGKEGPAGEMESVFA